jgi:hypothetical protein
MCWWITHISFWELGNFVLLLLCFIIQLLYFQLFSAFSLNRFSFLRISLFVLKIRITFLNNILHLKYLDFAQKSSVVVAADDALCTAVRFIHMSLCYVCEAHFIMSKRNVISVWCGFTLMLRMFSSSLQYA